MLRHHNRQLYTKHLVLLYGFKFFFVEKTPDVGLFALMTPLFTADVIDMFVR